MVTSTNSTYWAANYHPSGDPMSVIRNAGIGGITIPMTPWANKVLFDDLDELNQIIANMYNDRGDKTKVEKDYADYQDKLKSILKHINDICNDSRFGSLSDLEQQAITGFAKEFRKMYLDDLGNIKPNPAVERIYNLAKNYTPGRTPDGKPIDTDDKGNPSDKFKEIQNSKFFDNFSFDKDKNFILFLQHFLIPEFTA